MTTLSAFELNTVSEAKSYLQQHIHNHGPIPFGEYMALALYHPAFGYYMHGKPKFGREGDFITAPSLTPLFGETLSQACQDYFQTGALDTLIEIGAGNGALMHALLNALKKNAALPKRVLIIEKSKALRELQQNALSEWTHHPHCHIEWLEEPVPNTLNAFVIANEVLDALPFERFTFFKGSIEQAFVDFKAEKFQCVYQSPLIPFPESLIDLLLRFKAEDLYHFEYCPNDETFLRSIDGMLNTGVLVWLDYGYPEREYYHPQRVQGTFRAYRAHHVERNPLDFPGLCDLTASVNFTRLAHVGEHIGWELLGFTTQGHYLISLGILNHIQDTPDKTEISAAKMLMMPNEMGETIKVMSFVKQCTLPVKGFDFSNQLERL